MASVIPTTILTLATYPIGLTLISPMNVPDGTTNIQATLQRCTSSTPLVWPTASVIVTMNWEISLDGGVSWIPNGGFTAPGGNHNEEANNVFSASLLPGTNRQIRGSIDVSGGVCLTSGTVAFQ